MVKLAAKEGKIKEQKVLSKVANNQMQLQCR